MSHPHRDTGYTLIELLVVLVIVGILAIAGAAWSMNRPSAAVRGVTNDVYGLLRSAQTLARNSGRNVALQTQGTEPGRTLTLVYGFFAQKSDGTDDFTKGPGSTSANPVMGSLTIDLSLSRYAQVGDAATGQFASIMPNPAPQSDTVLKDLDPSSFWSNSGNNLFQGGSTPSNAFYFVPDGTPNADFYVPIVGVRSGVVSSDLPVGLILASRNNGLLSFLKSQSNAPTSPWSRL
ncbi:MAG: prepilin-type N-terminal cleavage/methylation domain-containing protein [Patescibacteria group bacterium]|nr:prepilin-type N-terminal cleavage/methylation domain-containing protein [Patescibacteria group bacterium]